MDVGASNHSLCTYHPNSHGAKWFRRNPEHCKGALEAITMARVELFLSAP